MTTNTALQNHITRDPAEVLLEAADRVECSNDVSLSIQVGSYLYCKPRNDTGPWTHVEVGFPSERPPQSWGGYCEDWNRPTETVYSYVPIEMVLDWINENGGATNVTEPDAPAA